MSFPSPGYLPNPGSEPGSPALQTDSLPSEPLGEFKGIENYSRGCYFYLPPPEKETQENDDPETK